MVSLAQLKDSEKVIIRDVENTPKKMYIDVLYIDKLGRHTHQIIWNKNTLGILESLKCDCTFCSNFNVNTNRLCIYKIAAIRELVRRRIWKPYILNMLNLSVTV